MRFLLAIAGLGLAFAAALFSTVARDSGNLWATLIFAASALLLAIVVGLTTVPYLARRVVGERLKDAFDYEVTRVGIFYVAAVLLIGIAALNTGNNLLYIVVSAMLAWRNDARRMRQGTQRPHCLFSRLPLPQE